MYQPYAAYVSTYSLLSKREQGNYQFAGREIEYHDGIDVLPQIRIFYSG